MEKISTRHQYRTRLFLFTFIIVVLGAALAAAGVFALLPADLGKGYSDVLSSVEGIGSVLLQRVTLLYAVIALCIVVAMVFLHLFYSHRVAGPAFRLGKEAAKIGQGNVAGKIRFRQKDNLTDMADTLNDVAMRYRTRVEGVKDQLAAIELQSNTLSDLIQRGKNGADLERAADELSLNVRKIDHILSEMRT